ncbi:60s ribosome subunit biogenesis protein nip7 [Stemphylium lycopersici]|uniref:60s ribosome subunit biogenesis protein nip7 n=1 Tax=Stemphylium lycopersici TaxID=183478 RepID=A0A364MTJ2_STELY|nr:60s ribosome subunit biogenesis protein nip7 [Stemphylium lycopersici]RAR00637.1 60s ribosome subunit biogenesis protein nip7 [Stemphylium lycopersici]RAR03001.1 60s ribosome subunit biogenesis protein nip7 [Stemphylium lycopersici]
MSSACKAPVATTSANPSPTSPQASRATTCSRWASAWENSQRRVWVKQNGEMPFLYGGNVLKAHVGRWSEDCPEHQGVVVLSMNDTPLGFGVSARSTADARKLDPTGIVTFRQADIGEYLREEDTLFQT